MGYKHRDNGQFSRAGWRKRLLLPCWIAQILLLLGMMGLFSYRLSHTARTWKEEEDNGHVPLVEFVWESVNVGFSFISLVVTFIAIARFIAEVLTPLPLLFGNILNLVLSSAILALDIVVYVQHADKQYSLIGLVMDCALIFFTLIPLFYSVVIYRRLLSYDDYHIPGNIKPYGFASGDEPEDTTYRSSTFEPPVPYDPTNPSTTAAATTTTDNTRPRSLSAASRRLSLNLNRNGVPQPSPSPQLRPQLSSERRASYNHERDTQFDEYVRRRSSLYTREDVEHAMGVEFGWQDEERAQRDSVVSAGMVPVAQARPRGDSLSTRQVSLEASISRSGSGSTTTTTTSTATVSAPTPSTLEAPNAMGRAHSLNSVPEAREEEDGNGNSSDRKALLSYDVVTVKGRSSRSSSGGSVSRIEHIDGLEEIELEGQKRKRGP
ncbi:hypothetical protein GGS23DRAFT_506793 [Durotheca rogersii]|uniref:uncharacterized protein n=1 Tax=Durotheca rogersii TaxID=419775 RepID=UPI00221FA80E|nr:uncharacterized protein GGS23DRAFT_506793 [Durotheca rogersii]KAI5863613.1 hypothetical protein GGS23DRAFT_506793 [Durotheca rogersii]